MIDLKGFSTISTANKRENAQDYDECECWIEDWLGEFEHGLVYCPNCGRQVVYE